MSNTPTVSLCTFIHNDLPMFRNTLIHDMKWADQICVLDLGSSDGLEEFCKAVLRPTDVYVRRPTNTCTRLGFAEAKNAAVALSTSEWAYFCGANTCIDWTQHNDIKRTLAELDENVGLLNIETVHVIPPKEPHRLHLLEHQVALKDFWGTEHHRNFIRKGSGIETKGYIHEEPFLGEMNAASLAKTVPIRRYHFGGWSNNEPRGLRYGWMLRRAMQNPELQKYTSPWWYNTFYPENKSDIESRAAEFERLYPEEVCV